MTSVVRFNITQRTAEGARVPIVDGGRVVLEPTRLIVVEGDPDEMVIPARITVPLVDGRADVLMDATGVAWCWRIVVRGARRDPLQEGYYTIPESATPLDYPTDLVEVDPKTLVPAESSVPAWEAAVSAVEGYAQAAADSAALAASEADSVEQTIAAEVQDWLAANPPAAGDDGREVEFGVSATHVQWRYVGDVAWTDLLALSSIVGATGATPEFQATASHLQWREPGGVWADLVPLSDLLGPKGDPGLSAYEVAVAAGFVGSEAEWLAALKGDEGDAAPLPVITATATTGTPGTEAEASVSGTYPNLSLDLTIPRGEAGIPTAYELRGTGMPNGVVTAPPGTYYTDTAGTNGAWRWLKKFGTGNTGWECIVGDTGWRNIASTAVNSWVGFMCLRRIGPTCTLHLDFVRSGTALEVLTLPGGFRPPANIKTNVSAGAELQTIHLSSSGVLTKQKIAHFGPTGGGEMLSWPSIEQWPATLPGTPA